MKTLMFVVALAAASLIPAVCEAGGNDFARGFRAAQRANCGQNAFRGRNQFNRFNRFNNFNSGSGNQFESVRIRRDFFGRIRSIERTQF